MASSGKRKTTMAKLTRERRLHERRLDKQAKKDARKRAAASHPGQPGGELTPDAGEELAPDAGEELTQDAADSGAPLARQSDPDPLARTAREG